MLGSGNSGALEGTGEGVLKDVAAEANGVTLREGAHAGDIPGANCSAGIAHAGATHPLEGGLGLGLGIPATFTSVRSASIVLALAVEAG